MEILPKIQILSYIVGCILVHFGKQFNINFLAINCIDLCKQHVRPEPDKLLT